MRHVSSLLLAAAVLGGSVGCATGGGPGTDAGNSIPSDATSTVDGARGPGPSPRADGGSADGESADGGSAAASDSGVQAGSDSGGLPPVDGPTYDPVEWGSVSGSFGGLRMYEHVPPNMEIGRPHPLVVVLHGCWEDAQVHATNTEWSALADRHRFLVAYAEEHAQIQQCFDWYSSFSQGGAGDTAGVVAMIEHMRSTYSVDPDRIFLSGFSAGGALGVILLATQPDLFAAGTVQAGLPYRGYTGSDIGTLGYIFSEHDRSPSQWAALMPSARSYPPILAFHGRNDGTVHSTYSRELMEQWTAVQGADQRPDNAESPLKPGHGGHAYEEYRDGAGEVIFGTVWIEGMAHGYPVDPSSGAPDSGGAAETGYGSHAPYGKDEGLYFAYYAARFFGLF